MRDKWLSAAAVLTLFTLATLMLAGCTAGGGAPADSYDWPRWRGPDGDGISKERGWNPQALTDGPKILWKRTIGFGFSGVAIKGSRVYALGSNIPDATVYCLDAESGKDLWAHTFEDGAYAYCPAASPTVDGDSLYALGSAGRVFCFKADSGEVVWEKDLVEEHGVLKPRYGFAASPIVEGGLLVITANAYGIALDKMTGALVWTSPTTDENAGICSMIDAYATPVIFTREGRKYFCQFDDYGLYAVDLLTGRASWFFPWPPEKTGSWTNVADPIVFSGKLFLSTGFGVGCVLLDISSGEPAVLWQNKNMNNHVSTCVLLDGHLYGCHDPVGWGRGGILRCLDTRTGKVMWEQDFKRTVSLSAADGKLLILTERGLLVVADASPKAYRELSRVQVFDENKTVGCWTPPVLCRGRIYCRSRGGELVCIDVRK
jgi:outer membrane protein assembly factor BamB